MADTGNKYIKLSSGQLAEQGSTISSAGAADTGKIVGLDATGLISTTMMPVGIAAETVSATAGEALSAGNFVNLYLDTTLKCRKADCSTPYRADGFVLAAYSASATALVYLEKLNNQVSGKTIGAIQYLSTAGASVETAPTTAGYIVQILGKAVATTSIAVEIASPITLA